MSVREKDNPALYAKIQEQNLLRQYDLLSNCIEIGLEKGIEAFDKYTLWALITQRLQTFLSSAAATAKNRSMSGTTFLRTSKTFRMRWIVSFR